LLVSLPVSTIKDTIFRRPPLFFSLFVVLDALKNKVKVTDLERAITDMDARFNDDEGRSKADITFYVACTSNPHRIRSRQIRDRYIRSFIG